MEVESSYQSEDSESYIDSSTISIITGEEEPHVEFKSIEDVLSAKILTIPDYVPRRGAVCAMKDCLDKLTVLKCIVNEVTVPAWTKPFEYRSLEQRYGPDATEKEDFVMYKYSNFKKLARDLHFILKVIDDGMQEFLECGYISSIPYVLDSLEREAADEYELFLEVEFNKKLVCSKRMELNRNKVKNKRLMNEKADEAFVMSVEYEDALAYKLLEKKYFYRWEDNRLYLNKFECHQAESALQENIDDYTSKCALEIRVHEEIKEYLDISLKEMGDGIGYWQRQYDVEIERLDQEIMHMTGRREQLAMDYEKLKTRYEERAQEITDWVELREELRRKAEELKIWTAAAIKIQAWWRGEMVRHHLGPYGKKKRGRGGGKKGKNAKKGKK